MRTFFFSLYGRISVIFLVLLVLLGVTQLFVSVESARNFSRESDQGLNRNLARDMAKSFEPELRGGLDRRAMAGWIHDLMIFNPRVEIYLLDGAGVVLAHFSGEKPLRRNTVDLTPIHAFLEAGEHLRMPIYGDDPRTGDGRKPFSVSPIRIGGRAGYLYLILGGEQYDSIAAMVEESYIIRNSVISLAVSLFLIGIAGLLIFFLLTKRLRIMVAAVRAFEQGDLGRRVPESQQDEIGQLGRAFNDMAERVESNLKEIQRADRLRRELVANVSHDLRSPLASAQGYVETIMMKESVLTPGERRHFLQIVYTSLVRLGTLVNEFFDLSRLEAREVEPNLEPFSLGELVQDVVVKFQPQALEKHVALTASFAHDLPFVKGDIAMIERVLTNLIENALRHTPKEGKVEVRLKPAGSFLVVCVADTGVGIPAAELDRVFDRFYRVDKSRARPSGGSGGSGIGLAIVKGILEMHGSEITVKNSTPAGSVFTFQLPTQPPIFSPPAPVPQK